MKQDAPIPEFTLFGGPLYRLGRRLGLVRGATDSLRLGLALGVLTWVILMLLAVIRGAGLKVLGLDVIAAHVRLLVALPLFFLCETWVAPRMAEFVRSLVDNGVVPARAVPSLTADIRRVGRLRDAWLVEVVLLLLALALPLVQKYAAILPGRTAESASLLTQSEGAYGPVIVWYMWVCLPLFRFLVLRWVWHLGLWWFFLWRLQRLDLRLVPTHPDRAAGLGFIEVVQEHFSPLAFAIAAFYAASFAEGIAAGTMAFDALYGLVPLLVGVAAVIFVGPLLIFSPRLWACRVNGWQEYQRLASRYVDAFDRRWIRDANTTSEALLGTADLQSLADLRNSVDTVREMRLMPGSRRLLVVLAGAMVVPLLPLLLFKYPLGDLTTRLFRTLTGL